jgi:serine/threonine protein kinase
MLIMPIKQGNLLTLMPLSYNMNDKTSHFYGLTVQMLSALTYLQEEGISHRNVKPTNILVEPTERSYSFYLTDFAITLSPSPIENRSCAYIYNAPETFTNAYPVTSKQDVWSLFVTLAVICRQVSEIEISRKFPGDAVRAIMEAGTQMPELQSMAQQNPTQRVSASVLFYSLRPRERITPNGYAEYPHISPEYLGLYGSGRLETDIVAVGAKADIRRLSGPLGLSPFKIIQEVPINPNYSLFPEVSVFGNSENDQDASSAVGFRETSASPASDYSQSPQGEQLQPEQRIKNERRMEQDQSIYRCTASCCTPPPTHYYLPNGPIVLPPRDSINHQRPLSSYLPSFYPPNQYAATPGPTTQRPTGTNIWQNSGAYDSGLTRNANSNLNSPGYGAGQQGAYVRPYPLACDYPTESSHRFED